MEERDENEDEVIRFEQLLVELDISVAEIAKLIGISSNAIYTMNSTKRGIPKKLLAALAKYESLKGHININWIITGMGPMFSPSESDVKAKLQADFMSLYHTMSGFQDIAESLQRENAELREEIIALQTQVTTLQERIEKLEKR